MRRQLSTSHEGRFHQEPNGLVPWIWTSQASELWENKFLLFSHSVCGILLWHLDLANTGVFANNPWTYALITSSYSFLLWGQKHSGMSYWINKQWAVCIWKWFVNTKNMSRLSESKVIITSLCLEIKYMAPHDVRGHSLFISVLPTVLYKMVAKYVNNGVRMLGLAPVNFYLTCGVIMD